jgi:hypothetical protein
MHDNPALGIEIFLRYDNKKILRSSYAELIERRPDLKRVLDAELGKVQNEDATAPYHFQNAFFKDFNKIPKPLTNRASERGNNGDEMSPGQEGAYKIFEEIRGDYPL